MSFGLSSAGWMAATIEETNLGIKKLFLLTIFLYAFKPKYKINVKAWVLVQGIKRKDTTTSITGNYANNSALSAQLLNFLLLAPLFPINQGRMFLGHNDILNLI